MKNIVVITGMQTSAASKSGESDTEDCQWKATAAVHTRFLSRTATYLRDLRFVCTVNWVIASLRRPFSLGCTIIAACSGTEEAAYAAATYVQADVVPLWTNEARGYVSPRLDRCFILRQILKAIVVALTTDKSIVIVAEGSLVDDAEQLVLFQHFVVHGGVAGGVCPEVLREAYQEQPSELVELLEAFGLSHYIEQVRRCLHAGIVCAMVHACLCLYTLCCVGSIPPGKGSDLKQKKSFIMTVLQFLQVFPDLTTPGPTAEPSDDNSHKVRCYSSMLRASTVLYSDHQNFRPMFGAMDAKKGTDLNITGPLVGGQPEITRLLTIPLANFTEFGSNNQHFSICNHTGDHWWWYLCR